MEPYVWYDPHELVKKLEWDKWLLKQMHNYEIDQIKREFDYWYGMIISKQSWK